VPDDSKPRALARTALVASLTSPPYTAATADLGMPA
jgi:hypothetical protein